MKETGGGGEGGMHINKIIEEQYKQEEEGFKLGSNRYQKIYHTHSYEAFSIWLKLYTCNVKKKFMSLIGKQVLKLMDKIQTQRLDQIHY